MLQKIVLYSFIIMFGYVVYKERDYQRMEPKRVAYLSDYSIRNPDLIDSLSKVKGSRNLLLEAEGYNNGESCLEVFRKIINPNKTNILVSAAEYGDFKVGGLGSLTNTLTPLFQEKYSSIYDSYFAMMDYTIQGEYEVNKQYLCQFDHVYDHQIVTTQIYKADTLSLPTFLFRSVTYPKMFDLPSKNGVYTKTNYSDFFSRMFYYASALKELQSFTFSENKIMFDIAHAHSYGAGLSFSLLNKDKPHSARVSHIHNHNYDQGQLEKPYCGEMSCCNLMFNLIRDSDQVLTVSEQMLLDGTNLDAKYNFKLFHGYNPAKKRNRVASIPNGIDFVKFNPWINLGNFNFDQSNITASKFKIKDEYLKEKGFISDPHKPLFLFVGRFSPEKGTDMLEAAAETVKESGGSLIIMGLHDIHKNKDVQDLYTKYKNDPDIFVFRGESYAKEQNNSEKTGLLVRAAADFMIVPSHEEAFGLVPIEGFAMGALSITSSIGGMKDYIKEFNLEGPSTSGNSFNYDEFRIKNTSEKKYQKENLEKALKNSIKKAFSYFKILNEEERSNISLSLIEDVKERWDWSAERPIALEKLHRVYQDLLNSVEGDSLEIEEELSEKNSTCNYEKMAEQLGEYHRRVKDYRSEKYKRLLFYVYQHISEYYDEIQYFNNIQNIFSTVEEPFNKGINASIASFLMNAPERVHFNLPYGHVNEDLQLEPMEADLARALYDIWINEGTSGSKGDTLVSEYLKNSMSKFIKIYETYSSLSLCSLESFNYINYNLLKVAFASEILKNNMNADSEEWRKIIFNMVSRMLENELKDEDIGNF